MSIVFEKLHLRVGHFELHADFSLKAGEKIALLGPSGGGKSTLLSALAGFVAPVGGRITVAGEDITQLPPARRPVTLLFQDHNLFPHLSVARNVGLGLKPDLRLSPADNQVIDSALHRVGLQDHADKLPAQLSGGQQQRVAIARALLRKKPVLLLDEPFAALGPALKHEMLDLVGEIVEANNMSLIMVTHQPEDARYIAQRTVLVAKGLAHAPHPTKDLLTNPPKALRHYLG